MISTLAGLEDMFRHSGRDASQPRPDGFHFDPKRMAEGAEMFGIVTLGPAPLRGRSGAGIPSRYPTSTPRPRRRVWLDTQIDTSCRGQEPVSTADKGDDVRRVQREETSP
jgi:hypothetical protein